jgi:hypothetical protein
VSTRKFVETAAANLMTIDVSIGKKSMVCKISGAVRSDILGKLAAQGEVLEGTDLTFGLFGPHQADFNLQVVAPRNKVRTYIYENTLPMTGSTRRIVPVSRLPQFLKDVAALVDRADAAMAAFMPHFDTYCEAGRKAADHNVRKSGVRVSEHMKYPSKAAFKDAFYIRITPPAPLPAVDLSKLGALPADLAGQIADANAALLADQLTGAKAAAMDAARAQMDTVVKQLEKGERLFPSLIENSKRVARMLREMTESYDRDPALLALADLIDAKIASVKDTEVWRNSPEIRKESVKAARTVVKGIKDLQKTATKDAKAAAKPKGKGKGKVIVGGLLGDLL